MSDIQFFKSEDNDILVKIFESGGGTTMAAGLTRIVPNSSGAAEEKHMPVATVDGDAVTVNVSTVTHPMSEEHFITTIGIVTSAGMQVTSLQPDGEPSASFALNGAKPLAAFEYCNLHGLWMTEV